MPCYTRVASTIEFGPGTDPALLAAALRALGYTVTQIGKALSFAKYTENDPITGTFTGGTMSVTGRVDQNELKRAYSGEVVKVAAKKFGWQVKQASESKFTVTKRG